MVVQASAVCNTNPFFHKQAVQSIESIGYIMRSFVCKPSTILVVQLPHGVLSRNIQQILHHRECITMSTCLGLPFSTSPQRQQDTQLSMEMDDTVSVQASPQHQAISSQQSSDAKSCSSADPQRSWWYSFRMACSVEYIQQILHHRECITMSTCLGLPFSTSPQRQQDSQLSMEMDDMVSVQASPQHQAISSQQSSDAKSCSSADPQRSWWYSFRMACSVEIFSKYFITGNASQCQLVLAYHSPHLHKGNKTPN